MIINHSQKSKERHPPPLAFLCSGEGIISNLSLSLAKPKQNLVRFPVLAFRVTLFNIDPIRVF